MAQLTILKEHPDIYKKLNEDGRTGFFAEVKTILREAGPSLAGEPCGIPGFHLLYPGAGEDYASAKTSDVMKYGEYFRYMLSHGIYLAPAQFEAMFLSAAIPGRSGKYAGCAAGLCQTEKETLRI